MARRSVWRGALLAALVLTAGCGSGGDGADEAADESDESLATLDIFSRAVTVRSGGPFEPAEDGQGLAEGDRVRTNPTGFAEVTFFEGSWMRVESGATLTLEALVDTEDRQAVSTSIDTGRSWQRVEELTGSSDEFEVETPVATAAVRGTEFGIHCPSENECTFSVVEGEVEITLTDGSSVILKAGQRLTVRRDDPLGDPEEPGLEALEADPWIALNRGLDEGGGESDPLEPEAVAGTYQMTRIVVIGNPSKPVGQTDEGRTTMSCEGDPCELGGDGWANVRLVGEFLRASGSYAEPCPSEAGTGTATTDYSVFLRAVAFDEKNGRSFPTRFEGFQTISTVDIPATCNAYNEPITQSVVLERVDAVAPEAEVDFGA